MNEFCVKIEQVREKLVKQHGDFTFFGLVKRKVMPKKWDVVVCADWLPKRELEAIKLIVKALKEMLIEHDFLFLSGVVILDKREVFIKELYDLKQNSKVYKNIIISSLFIKKLYVLQMTPTGDGSVDITQKFIAECNQICSLDNIEYKNSSANDYEYNLKEHYDV